jgi:ribosomal protein L11 methyltransferase
LEWIESAATVVGKRVLDVGTGAGILAIIAAMIGAVRVTAIDIDPEAVERASYNVRANAVQDRVEVSDTPLGALPRGGYDIVLSNLVPSVLIRVAFDLVGSLASSGMLLVAGYRSAGSPDILGRLGEYGLESIWSTHVDGWEARVFTR